jgi:hypothetical protein
MSKKRVVFSISALVFVCTLVATTTNAQIDDEYRIGRPPMMQGQIGPRAFMQGPNGNFPGRGPAGMMGQRGFYGSSTRPWLNGSSTRPFQPGIQMGQGVFGVVSSISGGSLSVTQKTATTTLTFTVDGSNAVIMTGPSTTSTLADIKVGDQVVVTGTVNGSTVIATRIMAHTPGTGGPMMKIDRDGNYRFGNASSTQGRPRGFFGRVGGFIRGLFGF